VSGILALVERRLRRALTVTGLLTLVVLMSANPAFAAQARRTWLATITGGGAAGTAVLILYPNSSGTVTVTVDGLLPSTTYAQQIYKGTCSKPTTLVKLPGLKTDSTGHGARTMSLSSGIGVAIWSVGPTGMVAFRLSNGSSARCFTLRYPIATRIAIAKYGIDLPVIHEAPNTFPYCNVAMYIDGLSQPGEAGPTMIYAHARTGMFLPLLTASKVRNGAAMVGMTVKVWTSDSRLYTYKVTRVARNVYTWPSDNFTDEQLWIQTSEGPLGTPHKLFILAKRVSVESSSFTSAHPTPHIVICH
jgi:hypothetical protein